MCLWICELIVFRYFSTSSALSLSAWSAEGSETLSKCAHCDNCTRSPESVEDKDVTLDAWKILKVAHVIGEEGGRTTLGMLADLVRGAGGGAFEGGSGGRGKGKGKAKEKKPLDLGVICGGKVDMSKEVSLLHLQTFNPHQHVAFQDVESLLITLLLQDYMKEEYSSTAYTINVYLIPGKLSLRLSRLSEEDVINGSGPRIRASFVKKGKGRKSAAAKKSAKSGDIVAPTRKSRVSGSASKAKGTTNDESDSSEPNFGDWPVRQSSHGTGNAVQTHARRMPGHHDSAIVPKRKRVDTSDEDNAGMEDLHELEDFIVDDDDDRGVARDNHDSGSVPNSDDDDGNEWAFSFVAPIRTSKPAPKRPRPSTSKEIDTSDIIELSD
jgi:ATP-dependent DNA helicase Q1